MVRHYLIWMMLLYIFAGRCVSMVLAGCMLLNWREYPSVSIYYVHKGLVVWTTTTVMLWQVKPAKMKKSRQADSSGGTRFISSQEGTYSTCKSNVPDMTLMLSVIKLKAMVPIKLLHYVVLATSTYVSHKKEAMVFLQQPNYFNFGQRKLALQRKLACQRCAKILWTINTATHAG